MSAFVKICGLTQSEHVAAAIEAGADAVGFVFAESVRRIKPCQAAGFAEQLPEPMLSVAVMLHPSNAEWQRVLREFQPNVLQTDAADFAELDVPDTVECWPVFREGGEPPRGDGRFVYEGPNSGRGETVDWSQARRLAESGNMILAGGLGPHNVADAIRAVRPWGVDVSSAVESAPGQKDPQRISDFVIAAKAAGTEQ